MFTFKVFPNIFSESTGVMVRQSRSCSTPMALRCLKKGRLPTLPTETPTP